jgi:hypothetical protein
MHVMVDQRQAHGFGQLVGQLGQPGENVRQRVTGIRCDQQLNAIRNAAVTSSSVASP